MLYPGAGELRERRVGVLAAVPAAQLPQGLQAGRAAAQALLASSSVHQTETGQRVVTEGSTPAALGAGMGMLGRKGLCVGGKCHPQCVLASGSVFSTCPRDLVGHCEPVWCVFVCVLVSSVESWCLTECLWQENESGAATCPPQASCRPDACVDGLTEGRTISMSEGSCFSGSCCTPICSPDLSLGATRSLTQQ